MKIEGRVVTAMISEYPFNTHPAVKKQELKEMYSIHRFCKVIQDFPHSLIQNLTFLEHVRISSNSVVHPPPTLPLRTMHHATTSPRVFHQHGDVTGCSTVLTEPMRKCVNCRHYGMRTTMREELLIPEQNIMLKVIYLDTFNMLSTAICVTIAKSIFLFSTFQSLFHKLLNQY